MVYIVNMNIDIPVTFFLLPSQKTVEVLTKENTSYSQLIKYSVSNKQMILIAPFTQQNKGMCWNNGTCVLQIIENNIYFWSDENDFVRRTKQPRNLMNIVFHNGNKADVLLNLDGRQWN